MCPAGHVAHVERPCGIWCQHAGACSRKGARPLDDEVADGRFLEAAKQSHIASSSDATDASDAVSRAVKGAPERCASAAGIRADRREMAGP